MSNKLSRIMILYECCYNVNHFIQITDEVFVTDSINAVVINGSAFVTFFEDFQKLIFIPNGIVNGDH